MTAKRIIIKNFQAHEDTVIELHPGINVFTGIGDSGKTSIKRLFDWVRSNRPTGKKFMNWNTSGPTSGEIVFDDGTVKHSKERKGGSTYTVNGEDFRKVKTSVPDVAEQLFRMGDINFQGQFDRPFLLTMTKGKLAEMFNRVANLDAVESWLFELNQLKGENTATAKHCKTMVELNKAVVVGYSRFDEFEREVNAAGAADAAGNEANTKAAAIHIVYGRIKNRLDRLEVYEQIDRIEMHLDSAERSEAIGLSMYAVAALLSGIRDKRQRRENNYNFAFEIAELLDTAEYHDKEQSHLSRKATDLRRLRSKYLKLGELGEKINLDKDAYARMLTDAGQCPICESTLDQKTIDKEINRYDSG